MLIEIEVTGGVCFVEAAMQFDDFMEMFVTGWYRPMGTIGHKVVELRIFSKDSDKPAKTIRFD